MLMVGPSGFEPPTSPLSGVRSNQLSYGPMRRAGTLSKERRGRLRREPAQAVAARALARALIPVMKGHKDDGNVL